MGNSIEPNTERLAEIRKRAEQTQALAPLDRAPVGEWPQMVLDVLADRDALAAELSRLAGREHELEKALLEAVEWLESRPDFTEGDAATASMCRAVLARESTSADEGMDEDFQDGMFARGGTPACPECDGRGEVAVTPGRPEDGPMPCPTCGPASAGGAGETT